MSKEKQGKDESFKENSNYEDTYSYNKKEIGEISQIYHNEKQLRNF